jgi:hypothetical protein
MVAAAEGIIRRLDAARQKWWFFTLMTTTVLAVCVSLASLLLFMGLDALVKLPQLGLLFLFLLWLGITGGLIYLVGRRLVRSHRGLEATARRVEAECPELDSELMNLVQLADDTRNENRAFCEAAIRQAATRIGHMQFDAAAERENRWRRFRHCMQMPRDLAESLVLLALLVAAAVACHLLVPNWGSAASRLLSPWEFVPSIGAAGKIKVTPGNVEVAVGSSVEIVAEIKNPDGEPREATLFVAYDGEAEAAKPMQADKTRQRFALTESAIKRSFKYRVEVGDSQSEVFAVTVRDKPTIVDVQVTYRYPAYLDRKPDVVNLKTPDLDAPQYTVADLRIRASEAINEKRSYVQLDTKRTGRLEEDGKAMVVENLPLLKDGTYTIHLTTVSNVADPEPRPNRIRVTPDRPPTVEIIKPGRQLVSAPGSEVAVMMRANDDHGIGRLRLEMKVQTPPAAAADGDPAAEAKLDPADNSPPTKLAAWSDFERSTTPVRNYTLALASDKFTAGQTVFIRAVAADKRSVNDWGLDLQAQETAGPWHAIRLIAEDVKSNAALEKLDNLRTNIWKILEKQIAARTRAATIAKAEEAAERASRSADTRTLQVDVQKTTADTVKAIGDSEKEEKLAVKRILNKLAFDEMLKAVELCDRLAKLADARAFEQPAGELTGAQDRIIEVLRKLLDAARQAESEVLSEMKKRPGGDLPDDTKKKFEEAKAKLEEFL